MHSTPQSPTAWEWGCRSPGRSLKRMAAACRPAYMMVRVRRFSLRCLHMEKVTHERGNMKLRHRVHLAEVKHGDSRQLAYFFRLAVVVSLKSRSATRLTDAGGIAFWVRELISWND